MVVTVRPEVFLGDGLRALHTLTPDNPAEAKAILDLLGLRATAPADRTSPVPPAVYERTEEPAVTAAATGRPGPETTREPLGEDDTVPFRLLTRSRGNRGAAGRPVQLADPLPPWSPSPAVLFDPPLRREWTRGVLFASAAIPLDGHEVDVARAVQSMVTGVPPVRLPRRRRWSTRLGVQLLIDVGPGIAPYRADRNWLVTMLADVVGRETMTVLRFAGCPTLGAGRGARSSWREYEPPAAGVPVLVFSDVTAFSPEIHTALWMEFADRVTRAGCHLVLVTPLTAASVPPPLRARVAVVQLDRRTVMAQARRAVARLVGRP